jgi:hypothetical protein
MLCLGQRCQCIVVQMRLLLLVPLLLKKKMVVSLLLPVCHYRIHWALRRPVRDRRLMEEHLLACRMHHTDSRKVLLRLMLRTQLVAGHQNLHHKLKAVHTDRSLSAEGEQLLDPSDAGQLRMERHHDDNLQLMGQALIKKTISAAAEVEDLLRHCHDHMERCYVRHKVHHHADHECHLSWATLQAILGHSYLGARMVRMQKLRQRQMMAAQMWPLMVAAASVANLLWVVCLEVLQDRL